MGYKQALICGSPSAGSVSICAYTYEGYSLLSRSEGEALRQPQQPVLRPTVHKALLGTQEACTETEGCEVLAPQGSECI